MSNQQGSNIFGKWLYHQEAQVSQRMLMNSLVSMIQRFKSLLFEQDVKVVKLLVLRHQR
jgi:hypothetical protein